MPSFGLSPKFSTPVEKTVEILQIHDADGLLTRPYAGFRRGESGRRPHLAPFGDKNDRQSLRNKPVAGAKMPIAR
jgi:hypothetical protein